MQQILYYYSKKKKKKRKKKKKKKKKIMQVIGMGTKQSILCLERVVHCEATIEVLRLSQKE